MTYTSSSTKNNTNRKALGKSMALMGMKSLLLLAVFLAMSDKVSAVTYYTHVCSNTGHPDSRSEVDTCTTDTVPAKMGQHKCCISVKYSLNAPYPLAGKTYRTCCHTSTTQHLTTSCSNDYAIHSCPATEKFCCPSVNTFYGSLHRGCCSLNAVTSCYSGGPGVGKYDYCAGDKSFCCPIYVGGGKCTLASSTCCSIQRCTGSHVAGKGNNGLLLSMISVATVVLFISMAIVPLPMIMRSG